MAPTSAPTPTPTPAAATLSLDEYLTHCAPPDSELGDDATYSDLSSELAAEADRLEALTPPAQLSEWHLLNIENFRTTQAFVDLLPKDDVINFILWFLIAGVSADSEEKLSEAAVRLPEDVLQQMIEVGCIDPEDLPSVIADGSDDHGDDIDDATTIRVGAGARGAVDYEGDVDYFRFQVEQGQSYQIDVALGSLDDSIVALFDADGLYLDSNDDFSDSNASRLSWQSSSFGELYVAVKAFGIGICTYTLTVTLPTSTPGPTNTPRSTATPGPTPQATPPADSFVSVSAGGYHTCEVMGDGSVACCGYNGAGQATPPAGSFVSVSAGWDHTCGVRSDGSVTCWGWNESSRSTPPAGSFVFVRAGGHHTCGIRSDGSVACWGSDAAGLSTPPAGSFTSVRAGGHHTCGLRSDGSVACWGGNWDGQATPPAGSFVSASAGGNHTCGLRSDGSIVCWGSNWDGQATPPAGSFVSVSAGNQHTCGLRSDGSVDCWGSDQNGQAAPHAGSFVSVSAGGTRSQIRLSSNIAIVPTLLTTLLTWREFPPKTASQ